METTNRIILAAMFLTAALFLGCAANAEQDEREASAAARNYLSSLDYGDTLAACEVTTFADLTDESQGPFTGWLRAMSFAIGHDIPDRELTESELRYLGVWQLPSGRFATVEKTLSTLKWYYRNHGRLPSDGIELLLDIIPLEGDGSFSECTTSEQLDRCFFMLNPITGKVHDTFEAASWAPGAFSIQVIDDPAELDRQYSGDTVPVDPTGNTSKEFRPAEMVWIVTIYGEEPGTVLYRYEWTM